MGNTITSKTHPEVGELDMSNGLTSVVLDVLVLNGSALAQSDVEKGLVVWFASRNQNVVGGGTVGFDIGEIPWSDYFEKEQEFILKAIDAATSKRLWDKLDYQPREDWTLDSLNQLRRMIREFRKKDVRPEIVAEWRQELPAKFSTCPKHGIYLVSWSDDHSYDQRSCLICSDSL